MKKVISLLIIFTMIISVQSVMALTSQDTTDVPTTDCAWEDQHCILDIDTSATITGGTGGNTGNLPPIIKCKWEYDLEVEILPDECDEPCAPCEDGYWRHDACCCTPGLQVKPDLYESVSVGYYAIVTDPEGVDHVDHVYADVWHPDGSFKYQIELFPVGFTGESYDKNAALDIWDHVSTYHSDLIKINDVWAANLPTEITPEDDILDELDEELAYLYYGVAELSYCQPGGWYYVGVRAHDGYDAWCEYLFNRFWYIPTAGIDVDFTAINYGTVAESSNKWVGGDYDFATSSKPTIRNTGNTPVELYVYQDDMDFGLTGMNWNVIFDARMNSDGNVRTYDPFQVDLIDIYGDPDDPANQYPGMRIPGILPLCTEEKLDFSIHVIKGFPGETYTGSMNLCALTHMDTYVWGTPEDWVGNAPLGVPQDYAGIPQPGPQ